MPRSHQISPYMLRQRWSIEDARAVVAAHAASGLSARAFARREGIDVQRLRRWRRVVEADGVATRAATTFVEVQPVRPRRVEMVEVVLRSGRVLRVSESVDVAVLARIADALEQDGPPAEIVDVTQGRFHPAFAADGTLAASAIDPADLALIVEGIDLAGARRRRGWEPVRKASPGLNP